MDVACIVEAGRAYLHPREKIPAER